ncbi:MAG: GGDEF domain-containing protein [Lachnospiraceae bacterium]|nr:GGDEF domain-containing protein [Lachnospiraceae bacterium]
MGENKINRKNCCEQSHNTILAAFQTVLDNTNDMMFVKDAKLTYLAASMPFVRMTGKERINEIVGKTDLEIFEDEELAKRYIADDRKLMRSGRNQVDYIEPIAEENGQVRYGSTSKYLLLDEDNAIIGVLGVTKDITKDYLARQHYQQEIKYLFELPEDTYAVSYIDVDSWRIISQRRQKISDGTVQACHSVESLCEAAIESILDEKCDAYEFYSNFNAETLREIYESGRTLLTFRYQRCMSDGSLHWVSNDIRFRTDIDSGHLCVMLSARNIDREKQEEQKLVLAAKMDKMTMVLNRATTMDSIRKILAEETETKHVLFMVDVDNFKTLNDTMGHQTGDEFLVALATEIRMNFRETDVVGRVGGDEFFALMRNATEMQTINKKAEDLLKAINKVCEKYASVQLSASIGISIYPEHGKTLDALYAKADNALYQAKRKGKNQFVFASL